MNNKNYVPYSPFKLWTIQNFPFIEADFDAITNYQLYSKIVEVLNQVITNQNTLQNSNNELINAYNELVNYVNNYFENLDVQDEINNKLDEMAESGELTDIIAQYLQLAGVLAYDTISDMSDAANLVDGSICYTLGQNTYNDGKGAFYKVREIINTDVVDGFNLVALDVSNTLVAERMPDYYINDLQTQINTTNTTLNRVVNKKYIFIGDSYAKGENEAHEFTTPWPTLVAAQMGLTLNDNLFVSAHNGSAFNYGYGFKNQLDEVYEDIDDPNSITDIVFIGGYNDRYSTQDVIDEKMEECFEYAKELYPNAEIKLGCVGWSKVYDVRQSIVKVLEVYTGCGKYGVKYLNNVEWILHDYSLFCSDNYHPTQEGQNELAKYITQALLTGSCDIQRWVNIVSDEYIEPIEETDTFSPAYCIQYQNNGMIIMAIGLGYIVKTTAVTIGSNTTVPLAKLTGGLMYGGGLEAVRFGASCFVATSGGSGQAEINGTYGLKYDPTNNECLIEFISSKRSGINANIAAINQNPIYFVAPASYC